MDLSRKTKTELRAILKARLAGLSPADVEQRSARACELLADQPEYQRTGVIMAFLSLPSEINTAQLVLRAWQDGKRVLAPRVSWEQHRMIPVEIRSLTADIEDTQWSLRQPVQCVPVAIEMIDLVIVPGLGFDLAGSRLGRGRGFYDRFLAQPALRGLTCGLGFEEQVAQHIPTDAHDIRVKLLVTDQRVRRFA